MKYLTFSFFSLFLVATENRAATLKTIYEGQLVDGVTQWPTGIYSLADLSKKIIDAGVSKAGISINAYNPTPEQVEKSSKDINLNKRFYKGSPKYFHFAAGLNTKKTDSLILEIKKNDYKYISEIMYRHADKKQGLTTSTGERSIDPLSKDSIYLISRINQNYPKLPIFIHWEFYEWKNDFPKFNKLFKMFPSHSFIINHMGFGNVDQVKTLLKNNPNVYFTISKRNKPFEYFRNSKTIQGPPIFDKNKRVDLSWKNLFIAYSDRFLFATDSHKDYMWENYSQTIRDYREILGQLPDSVAKNIAYQNAEKMFNLNQ